MARREDDEIEQDDSYHLVGLLQWLDERYRGDERFASTDLEEPGSGEGETGRLRLPLDEATEFFVAVLADEGCVRVGLATDDEELSETIESTILETGNSLTEYLAESMETLEDLDYEVQHFHDEAYYFCSDLPFDTAEELGSPDFRERVLHYLEGYVEAMLGIIEGEA